MRLDIGQRDWFGVGTSQPLVQIMGEVAVYDATANKTFIVWQGPRLRPNITYYDHVLSAWGPIVEISALTLTNDDHGAPSICQDASGFLHVFWGTHNHPVRYAISTNARDISTWTVQTSVSTGYAYQQPFVISGNIFLIGRRVQGTSTTYRIAVTKSNGVAKGHTWPTGVDLVSFAARMMYPSCYKVSGSDIHFVFWRRDNPTGPSRNIYYAVYETDTGLLRNAAGATFAAPISEATGNASFMAFDSLTDEANAPTLWLDSGGNPHVAFIHSDLAAGLVYLKHTRWDGGWTTPVALASGAGLWGNPAVIAASDTAADLYWISAGSVKKTSFNPSDDSGIVTTDWLVKGSWPSGALNYIGPVAPSISHPDLNLIVSEINDGVYWYEHVRIAAYGAGVVQADGARQSYQIAMPFNDPTGATILQDYAGHGQNATNTSLILGVEGANGLTGAQLGGEATIPHTGAQWMFGGVPCTVRFWGKDLSGSLLGKGRPSANSLRYSISLSAGKIVISAKKTATWKTASSTASLIFTGMHFYELAWDGVNTFWFRADGLDWGTSTAIVAADMTAAPTNALDLGYAYISGSDATAKSHGAGVWMGLTMLPRHQSTLAEHQAEWAALQTDWGI